MSERRQTLIVSDLHLGGGGADPGDDHVYQNRQLERFVRQSLASPAGQEGQIELFFNGDFLEFAQVRQQAYRSPSTRLLVFGSGPSRGRGWTTGGR